jgi:hypothetical protein
MRAMTTKCPISLKSGARNPPRLLRPRGGNLRKSPAEAGPKVSTTKRLGGPRTTTRPGKPATPYTVSAKRPGQRCEGMGGGRIVQAAVSTGESP